MDIPFSFFPELWRNDLTRYLAATLFGAGLAYFIEWLGDRRRDSRLRRATRESLVAELTDNLVILDAWERCLKRLLDPAGHAGFPGDGPRVVILERCLDRQVSVVLSEIEQVQATFLFYQLKGLEETIRGLRGTRVMFGEYRRVLEEELPYIGQTIMDLLVEGLIRQGRFSFSRSAVMASALIPVLKETATPNRAWRSSDLDREGLAGPTTYVVVWRNDGGVRQREFTVAELYPARHRSYRTINPAEATRWSRWLNPVWRRRRRQVIEQAGRQADEKEAAMRAVPSTASGGQSSDS